MIRRKALIRRFEEELELMDRALGDVIKIKIERPPELTPEEFKSLESNPEFLNDLKEFVKAWVITRRNVKDKGEK